MRLLFVASVAFFAVMGCTDRVPAKDYGGSTGEVLCMSFGGLSRKNSDGFVRRGDTVELTTSVTCKDGSRIFRTVTNW